MTRPDKHDFDTLRLRCWKLGQSFGDASRVERRRRGLECAFRQESIVEEFSPSFLARSAKTLKRLSHQVIG